MSDHTPGPWTVGPLNSVLVMGSDGDVVALAEGGGGTIEANACLIASAPELLTALEDLRTACGEAYTMGRIPAEPFVRAGNVIAKAYGK